MRVVNWFHVIDGHLASYHVLLSRTWVDRHKVVPSTYKQCLKIIWLSPSLQSCLLKQIGRGAFLLTWEDLKGEEPRPDALTSTSTRPPRPKSNGKETPTIRALAIGKVVEEGSPTLWVDQLNFMMAYGHIHWY